MKKIDSNKVRNNTLFSRILRKIVKVDEHQLPAEDQAFQKIWDSCSQQTMISFERGLSIFRSVRYVVENNIKGDFVECGLWRGGSAMIAVRSLMEFGDTGRIFHLFDTFAGMTEAGEFDVDHAGVDGAFFEERIPDGEWCFSPIEVVRENLASTGYQMTQINLIKGDVRETAFKNIPNEIAYLRLDTDFYDSTKVEMECFWPKLGKGGAFLIDDYGHWQGARKAVDEYFSALRERGEHTPLLCLSDYTGRMAVK